MQESIKVRKLTQNDAEDLLQIEKALGSTINKELRASFLEFLASSESTISLGAELDGKLIGFIAGELKLWAFGGKDPEGWVRELGVNPDFQGQGIGALLGRELLLYFKSLGVKRVKTLVEWDSGDVISYFGSLGFNKGSQIVLEVDLKEVEFLG